MRTSIVRMGLCALLAGCASSGQLRTDATLDRVVVYKNGIALFERRAVIDDDNLRLTVPAGMVDDVLKSLRIVDVSGKKPVPAAFPTTTTAAEDGLVHVDVALDGPRPHQLEISYLAESPTWKPTYRVTLGEKDSVLLEGWALVDNTSGEDWREVRVAVASSAALSFRYDLHSVRPVTREELGGDQRLALAPPVGQATYGGEATLGATPLVDAKAKPQPDAVGLVAQIDELHSNLTRMLEDARQHRDVVLTLCMNDKVNQVDVSARSAREHLTTLESARSSGNLDVARHEVTILAVLAERAQQLAAEAQQCVGREAGFVGETSVTTTVDPQLPPDADSDGLEDPVDLPSANRRLAVEKAPPPTIPQAAPVTPAEEAARQATARLALLRDSILASSVQTDEPVGSAHFETAAPLSVAAGQAAMIPIVKADTKGEVVYFQPPMGASQSPAYPFRAVRLKNPTDSVLESGPLTVFGEGRFVGEGISEPIPAHGAAFVPFALDRQVVVERADEERERIVAVQGVDDRLVAAEVERVRRVTYTIHDRGTNPAVIYVGHRPEDGWKLADPSASIERMGPAHLFRLEIAAGAEATLTVEEVSTTTRSIDVRAAQSLDLLARFASEGAGPLAQPIAAVVAQGRAVAELEARVAVRRGELVHARARLAEVQKGHDEIKRRKAPRALVDEMGQRLHDIEATVARLESEVAGLENDLVGARLRLDDAILALPAAN
jgi:hypothetical protein